MRRRIVLDVASYAVLVIAGFISILPFAWALAMSFRTNEMIFRYATTLSWRTFVPTEPTLSAYRYIFGEDNFARYLLNSFFVAMTAVGTGLFVNSLAAFGFARFEFRGKEALFTIILATFMVTFEIIVVPLYLVIRQLGWMDTYQALIVPGIADAFSIFLLRQFFTELPRDIEDAARMDGASWLDIYRQIALPLARPALVTSGLLMFLAYWDSFFWPLVVTRSQELSVVQVAVNRYITTDFVFWDRVFAASVVVSSVSIALFIPLQRFYVRGISLTGLK